MEDKIKKSLDFLNDLDFDVWFSPEVGCGHVILRHRSVTSTLLDLICKVVDLVAITCIAPETYRITFMTK